MRGVVRLVSLPFAAMLATAVSIANAQPAGPEFRVNVFTTDFQEQPEVAYDPSGAFVVAWGSYKQDGSNTGIFARRFSSAGVPLTGDFRVNTFTAGLQYAPDVAVAPSGTFCVVWASSGQAGPGFDVFGQRFAASGAPAGGEFRINTHTVDIQYLGRVAADSTGGFVVVWEGYAGAGTYKDVFGQRFAGTGEPLGGEFRGNTFTVFSQYSPDVATHPSGGFVVVWQSYGQDGYQHGIFGQRFTNTGAPSGGEFRASTYTTSEQIRPRVAFDSSGTFMIVWQSVGQEGGYSMGIFGQRFSTTGTPLGPEFRVNAYTPGTQSRAAIAPDRAGGFLVTWQGFGQDGADYGIFGRRIGGSGAPIGSDFRVNTRTSSYQVGPAIASDPKGSFTIVWHGDAQDGSSTGVFAQRFLASLVMGDVNGDGAVNVTDVLYLINYLFAGGPPPAGRADTNGDGVVNVTDVLYLINHLFAGGPAPV